MTDSPDVSGVMGVQANLSSLGDLAAQPHPIRVPIYQRLYVWDGDTIRTLLDDIHNAYAASSSTYYIGALLIRRDNTDNSDLEVIDGQQRLTTLWLVGLVYNLGLERAGRDPGLLWSFVGTPGKKPSRLRFDIREDVDDWCNRAIQERRIPDFPKPEGNDQEGGDLVRFRDALAVIRGWFQERFAANTQKDRVEFELFLTNNVRFLLTTLPGELNAVRMFEAVNDRSVQLAQHEVLKARLLHHLPAEGEKTTFGAAWDDCAQMDRYIEHYRPSPHHSPVNPGQSEAVNNEPKHLWDLLDDEEPEAFGTSPDSGQGSAKCNRGPEVESIISFPVLLLHALRIWIIQRTGERAEDLRVFQDRELLQLFQEFGPTAERWDEPDTQVAENPASRVREFLYLLCELRWAFDAWVIKWVWKDHSRELRLRTLNDTVRAEPVRREEEQEAERPLSMIQAHLYHTQPARRHLWLTPWLAYLHRRCVLAGSEAEPCWVGALEPAALQQALQTLDDYLFCTPAGHENAATKEKSFEATRAILSAPPGTTPTVPNPSRIDCSPLLGFYPEIPHYWFYKIDLILWLQWWQTEKHAADWPWVRAALSSACELVKESFRDYRFTSRHSVEHIYPQNPVGEDRKWPSKDLDRLGNLGLVSGGWNSEDSNKEFSQKRENFKARLKQRHGLLSPKLALIYTYGGVPYRGPEPEQWHPEEAEAHEQFVIETIEQWFRASYASKRD